MTYVNPVYRHGIERFLDDAAAAGVAGLIVPDLPVDESAELEEAAGARGGRRAPGRARYHGRAFAETGAGHAGSCTAWRPTG